MFIVIEGLDGSGKSTQARMLAESLRKEGHDVNLTAEPTESMTGSLLRRILSGYLEVDAKTLALLFTADRMEHLDKEIKPSLDKGEVVVCERYYHSTVAYQAAQGIDRNWLLQLNCKALEPDATFYLDIEPSKAINRSDRNEIFEEAEFLKKVQREYDKFKEIIRLDGNLEQEEISKRIQEAVSDVL